MEKFTLGIIMNKLYKNDIFGDERQYVKIRNKSRNNPIENIGDYGIFNEKSTEWKDYINRKYSPRLSHFNTSDFIFIHFANIKSISQPFRVEQYLENRNRRGELLHAKDEKRSVTDREEISNILFFEYDRAQQDLNKKWKKTNIALFGSSIGSIMNVNEYVISQKCKINDYSKLSAIVFELLNICKMDTSLSWGEDIKEKFVRHLQSFDIDSNKKKYFDKDLLAKDLAYVLSWLLLAALLRNNFSDFANKIPDNSVTVQLVNDKSFEYIRDLLDKRIKKELSIQTEKLGFTEFEIKEYLFLSGEYYIDSDNTYKTNILELFDKTWNPQNDINKNIIVLGPGGIGKTLSILSILAGNTVSNKEYNMYSIPSIYIPLKNIEGTKIKDYICEQFIGDFEKVFELFRQEDTGKTNAILFLDGINEVGTDHIAQLEKDIYEWVENSKKFGFQIILTSRSMPDFISDFNVFEAERLNENRIRKYINEKYSLDIKNTKIYKLLSTPLLLTLFCNLETIRNSLDSEKNKSLDWTKYEKESDVFWNYIQYEIYECYSRKLDAKLDNIYKSDYYFIALLLGPYLAWNMVNNNTFTLDDDKLYELIGDGIDYFSAAENIFDNKINSILRQSLKKSYDKRSINQKKDTYYELLTSFNVLMKKDYNNHINEYSFMHQEIRDYYAALFVKNALFRDKITKKFLSDEVVNTKDDEVFRYLSEITNTSELFELWEMIKVPDISILGYEESSDVDEGSLSIHVISHELKNNHSKLMIKREHKLFWGYRRSVKWFLSFFGYIYKNDYSCINFSNMDLSYINLTEFNNNRIKLSLPHNPDNFRNTKISKYTFDTIGHTNKVNAICILEDLNICISGDSDGKVYVWDLNNNKIMYILDCYGREIYDIKNIKHHEKYYIAVCSNEAIDLFLFSSETMIEDNFNWLSPDISIKTNYEQRYNDTTIEYINYVCNPCHSVEFYDDGSLHVYYASDAGEIGRYNIDDDTFEKTLFCKNESCINKIEIVEINGKLYCVVAKSDFSIEVLNITDESENIFQIENTKKVHDDFSYIEDSHSWSKEIWNDKKNGITDFKLYHSHSKYNVFVSDSNGKVHIINNIFNEQSNRMICINDETNGHTKCINKIELLYSKDSIFAVTCSNDSNIIIWDLKKKKIFKKITAHTDWVTNIEKIDEKRVVSFGHDNTIFCWDIDSGEIKRLPEHTIDWIICGKIYVRNDDIFLVTGDASGAVSTWNLNLNRQTHFFSGALKEVLDVKCFKRNGNNYIVTSMKDGTIRIWGYVEKKCVAVLEGHEGWVNAIQPCCNGGFIISCGSDKTVRVYNITDLKNPVVDILYGHHSWVINADIISEKGNLKFVTCSYDKSFIIWEKNGDTYNAIRIGQNTLACSYFPKSVRVKSGSIKPIKVKFSNNDASVHEAGIKCIKVLDDNRIITGGYDGKVVLWDVEKIKESKEKGILVSEHNDWVTDIITLKNSQDICILSSGVDGKISRVCEKKSVKI